MDENAKEIKSTDTRLDKKYSTNLLLVIADEVATSQKLIKSMFDMEPLEKVGLQRG